MMSKMLTGTTLCMGALVACVVMAGCASTPGASDALRAERRAAGTTQSDDTQPANGSASEQAAGEDEPDQSGRSPMSETELSVWHDPAFRKAFQRSYIAETEIEPRVTVEEREQMQQILKLISDEDLDGAIKQLESIRGENTNPLFDYTQANIHFQRNELDKAADLYHAAVEKKDNFRRAWSNLGKIHVRTGDYESATRALTRVIETGGGDGTTFGLLGYAYAKRQMHIPAESAYRRAIVLDPDTRDWKLGLAQSFFKQQRYGEAAAFLDQLIRDEPENADYWLLQANAYIGLDQAMKAAENYELIDQLGESTYQTLNTLGDIYINEGLYDTAVHSYIRAMELEPQREPHRAIQAAKVMAARGAYDATETLVKQIETGSSDQIQEEARKDLLKLRARIAATRGANAEQAEVLEQIVAIDPMDGEALMLLGSYYARVGEMDKAKLRYEQAASIEGYEADGKVRVAQLLVNDGKYQEALRLLRRAQELNFREHVQDYLEQVERVARQG